MNLLNIRVKVFGRNWIAKIRLLIWLWKMGIISLRRLRRIIRIDFVFGLIDAIFELLSVWREIKEYFVGVIMELTALLTALGKHYRSRFATKRDCKIFTKNSNSQ